MLIRQVTLCPAPLPLLKSEILAAFNEKKSYFDLYTKYTDIYLDMYEILHINKVHFKLFLKSPSMSASCVDYTLFASDNKVIHVPRWESHPSNCDWLGFIVHEFHTLLEKTG